MSCLKIKEVFENLKNPLKKIFEKTSTELFSSLKSLKR